MIVSMKQYLRFGTIPKGGKSSIWENGIKQLGKEKGLSVYDCILKDGEYKVIVPSYKSTVAMSFHSCITKECFLVIGEELKWKGSDGEPLLLNVRIIKELGFLNK